MTAVTPHTIRTVLRGRVGSHGYLRQRIVGSMTNWEGFGRCLTEHLAYLTESRGRKTTLRVLLPTHIVRRKGSGIFLNRLLWIKVGKVG